MKNLMLFVVLLAGCASTGEYRENSFKPKKGPSCPGDQYAICDMHMGKPLICECVNPVERGEIYDYETE
jgi:hypothetical protein